MPLLRREVDISPHDLFVRGETERPWWVAHTRSRQEKALARHLLSLGIPFYLPQREKSVRRAGRILSSYLPLFPGYVFFRGSPGERQAAVRSRLLVQVLHVPNQTLLQGELAQVYELQRSGATIIPYQEFRPGDAVRIIEGSFQGYSGVVIRPKARMRFIVSITMLRKSLTVEFDREILASSKPFHRSCGEQQSAIA